MDNNDSKVTKSALQLLIEEAGFDTRPYEGRGRYGKPDLGVDIKDASIGNFVADVMQQLLGISGEDTDEWNSAQDAIEEFRSMRTDNLGRGIIVYFPGVAYGTVDAEEEDGDTEETEEET